MDRTRLETLARTLARSDSRRGALRLAAAVLVGVGAESTLNVAQARHKHKRCTAPTKQRCDGTHCVNLLTDLNHCGGCGQACGAGFTQCVDGMCCSGDHQSNLCRCAAPGSVCNAHTCCQGACANGFCS